MNAAPENYQSIRSVVAGHAVRIPDKIYVHCIDQGASLSYGELHALANRMAHFFRDAGLKANDRILMLAENSVEFIATFVGTLSHGATISTANVEMNRAHIQEIVRAIAPKIVLYQEGLELESLRQDGAPENWMALGEWGKDQGGPSFFGALANCSDSDDVPPVGGPDDVGVIFYTSGTEAKPKGVMETHKAVWHNFDASADCIGLQQNDRMLDCRSYTWLSAQNMSLGGPLTRGATVHMAGHFSRSRYFDWVRKYRIDIAICVPTMINMFLNEPVDIKGEDVPHLRFMTSSSAPLLVEPWKHFEDMYGITLCQSYGCSEGGLMCGHRGTARKIGTIGPPLKYQTIRIVDSDGNQVPEGAEGEIVVSGPQKSYGYLHADGTAEVLPVAGHRTGDLGCFDADGHLRVTGRLKDQIIRGGVNISPVEVDNVLAAHPDIAEAAAVGVPDPIYGEEVVSFVVCKAGATPSAESVLAHCAAHLAEFKRPKQVIFRDALPRNARGKLDRNSLADEWKRQFAAV
jgi:acyl-coenzyme A synthetase/AMP-(fatty) acid ligase